MNLTNWFQELNIDISKLTPKKQQTTKKIEYIREYVVRWAVISAERDNVETINFIDCMCNAGVYQDGDFCTAIEVLLVFVDLCRKYPNKQFRVFCNDIDPEKIETLKKVVKCVRPAGLSNLDVFANVSDVNDYLVNLNMNQQAKGRRIFGYGASTILYIDPFDFGTVEIPKISDILQKNYCELIFNFFLSDYVRNIKKDNGRIAKCIGGQTISTKDELVLYMRQQLRVGSIKYLFTYQFRTMNNIELYQIVFATPNIRGLEVLKEVLWKVFNGAQFHRNKRNSEEDQLTFFTPELEKDYSLQEYSSEAIEMLRQNFYGKQASYKEIETFLIENTMLSDSQIIKNVLKPMIDSNELHKQGLVKANNYKHDMYSFR